MMRSRFLLQAWTAARPKPVPIGSATHLYKSIPIPTASRWTSQPATRAVPCDHPLPFRWRALSTGTTASCQWFGRPESVDQRSEARNAPQPTATSVVCPPACKNAPSVIGYRIRFAIPPIRAPFQKTRHRGSNLVGRMSASTGSSPWSDHPFVQPSDTVKIRPRIIVV